MKSLDADALKSDLHLVPWSTIDVFDDVDYALSAFESLFNDVWDLHAPMKTVRRRHKVVPWISKDINALRRNRDHHYQKFLRNKSDINWVHYKQSSNKCNMAVRNAKRNFLISGLHKPTNTLWRHLKACVGSSTSRRVQLPWPANTGKEAAAVAQIINEFLSLVVKSVVLQTGQLI